MTVARRQSPRTLRRPGVEERILYKPRRGSVFDFDRSGLAILSRGMKMPVVARRFGALFPTVRHPHSASMFRPERVEPSPWGPATFSSDNYYRSVDLDLSTDWPRMTWAMLVKHSKAGWVTGFDNLLFIRDAAANDTCTVTQNNTSGSLVWKLRESGGTILESKTITPPDETWLLWVGRWDRIDQSKMETRVYEWTGTGWSLFDSGVNQDHSNAFVDMDGQFRLVNGSGSAVKAFYLWRLLLTLDQVDEILADPVEPWVRVRTDWGRVVTGAAPQFMRPAADDSNVDAWQNELGGTTNIWQSIDEADPDAADFIRSPV